MCLFPQPNPIGMAGISDGFKSWSVANHTVKSHRDDVVLANGLALVSSLSHRKIP